MKRKTNLFYTDGPDSKFLTFSNYTECLTGNFLSLESKLFPDKFLCLKIHNLNKQTKAEFIKYLVAYYENKLAILRDYNIQKNYNVETDIHPLAYLLEAILYVCENVNGKWTFSLDKLTEIKANNCVITDLKLIEQYAQDVNDEAILKNLITYVGETTEQDYNGIYADTICTIDLNLYNEGELILKNYTLYNDEELDRIAEYNTDNNILYGWENDNLLIENYLDVRSIYDIQHNYNYKTSVSKLKLKENLKNDAIDGSKTLEFNIIIPLFSLVNRNIKPENCSSYAQDENNFFYINLNNIHDHVYNVPYGIWINAEDEVNDTFIELKKDMNLNMYPSWSLLISSQFKPFPYSNSLVEENYSKDSIMHAHSTYSEILSKLNNFMDTFSTFNNELIKLNNRITTIEASLKEIGTVANISDTNKKLINTETRITNMINDFKEKIYGYIDNITWSNHIQN